MKNFIQVVFAASVIGLACAAAGGLGAVVTQVVLHLSGVCK